MRSLKTAAGFCAALILPSPVFAAPYIPDDDAQVIETLPGRNDPAQRQLNRLRTELAAAQNKLPVATELARRYIGQARSEGDPRYLGYAQAVLAPWWNEQQPPEAVRVLRATIYQSTHQFQKALTDLNAVLKTDRSNVQAWLTRATILQVQGDYEQAGKSCMRLYGLAPALITTTCLANVGSLNGHAQKSYELLDAALKKNADADSGIKIWILTLLAEMAARNGDNTVAEKHFRQALALDGADMYLLGAYSDFLLDRQRPSEVVTLLETRTRVDSLLLRYALALHAQHSPAAAEQIESLRARFNAAMMREDTVHQREQARFELELLGHPKAALELAQRNWN
ncbi:MAG: hypothetical protein JWQ21_1866, partial [Herminiimonas sp.]|nr:hypothetical protein [Herminiimonas sp.]